MKLKLVILLLLLSVNSWALDIDVDNNNAVDVAYGGTNSTTSSDARTALGLEIGVDVEAYDATILKFADIGVTVQEYAAQASQAEMEEGTVFDLRMMTPQGVAQAIAALAGTGRGRSESRRHRVSHRRLGCSRNNQC